TFSTSFRNERFTPMKSLLRFSVLPDMTSFGTIRTDIDLIATLQQIGSEPCVRAILPDLSEAALPEIPQPIPGIFIKATGNHGAIPGDHASMPELPTVIVQLVLDVVQSIGLLCIAGIFFIE